MKYTGKQIEAEDCYICSTNRQNALYVINTKYNWELCAEEWRQQINKKLVKSNKTETEGTVPSYQNKVVVCSMQCLLYLGSSN